MKRFLSVIAAVVVSIVSPAVSVQADNLYIPLASKGARGWFTQDEFEWALRAAGYDPAVVAEYTWCELDDTAAPPDDIRYSVCHLDMTPDNESDSHEVIFWWDLELGRMWWAEISSTREV